MRTANPADRKGFTLMEVLFVMVMITVLTVVFIGQMRGDSVETLASFETLRSHLRSAQTRAMSTSGVWYVQFGAESGPKSYTLYENTAAGPVARSFTGASGDTVTLAEGISVAAGLVVAFDRLGRPFTDAGATAAQVGVRSVATSAAGAIEIKPQTGYIP